jgi:hypothetical protein
MNEPDRAFWLEIRRAALTVVKAIEQRYGLGSVASPDERQTVTSDRRETATPRR